MVAMYSHQPWIADTDVAGKADISANGRFDVRSLDHVQTFGLGDYGTNAGNWAGYAMVVGVRCQNRWEIYGQDLGLSNIGPPVKVVRII